MSEATKDRSTLTVRVEPELLTRFQIACVRKRKSMSDEIRKFIDWYVRGEEGEQRERFER